MFKKRVKISNSHAVSNKDKKSLKELMAKLQYDKEYVEYFFNDKNYEAEGLDDDDIKLAMDKVQGQRYVLYQRNGTPYLFKDDHKSVTPMPSMYMLFEKCPSYSSIKPLTVMPLRIFLKLGVENFIFNGADLMWPGVVNIDTEPALDNSKEYKQGQLVVIYAYNGSIDVPADYELTDEDQAELKFQQRFEKEDEEVKEGEVKKQVASYAPVAIGKMFGHGDITEGVPKKGKAAIVEHYLFDELWNMGSRKIPQGFQIKADIKEDGTDQEEEEKKQEQDQDEEEEEKVELTQQEWDLRIQEAFQRTIYEIVQDEDLPMEPSDFQKILQEYSLDDQTKIDLKKSSYKKIGKLLDTVSTNKGGMNFLDYVENKAKGHKLITKIYKDKMADFAPQFKLKRTKTKQVQEETKQVTSSVVSYPIVKIDEVFSLGRNIEVLNEGIKEKMKKPFYVINDVKNIINTYVAENELEKDAKRGHIKLDPKIGKLAAEVKPGQIEVKKEFLYKNITSNLHKCYTVTLIDESQLVSEKERMKVFKGEVPQVELISQKISNKKQTTITGLDLYMIDFDELTTHLQHKCASSVAINEIEHLSTIKAQKFLIKIQGSQIKMIEDILVDRYGVPRKYITSKDLCGGKKKKN